ncbi:MAG: lytic transglycosylase domain-containing protein [Elusimicrobiota bacterium]|jgi:soluble lytic murein transglycosylase|nr:lytic transglycosylase domain-containing protein [Elusimicrobiota bacterium]
MNKKVITIFVGLASCIGVFIYFFYTLIFFNGSQYEALIDKYSKRYEVDPMLVRAVMKRESNVNPDAVSSKGAIGLMQIMPKTGVEIAQKLNIPAYHASMLKDPEINIMFGIYYLRNLLRHYDNDMVLALGAYNAGIGNIDILALVNDRADIGIKDLPFKETSRHIRAIMLTYQFYKGEEKLKIQNPKSKIL